MILPLAIVLGSALGIVAYRLWQDRGLALSSAIGTTSTRRHEKRWPVFGAQHRPRRSRLRLARDDLTGARLPSGHEGPPPPYMALQEASDVRMLSSRRRSTSV